MTDLDPYLLANRANWEERADIHIADDAGFYGIQALVAGAINLTPIERAELPDIRGKRVAHLQCHIGTNTLSLKRLGAQEVVGLDFSAKAVAHARDLAKRCGVEATFVEGEVTRAPELLGGDFDLVFTTWGTLCWHRDMDAWANSVARMLKPGGTLYFLDLHPVAHMLEVDAIGSLALTYPYQSRPDQPHNFDAAVTYTGSEKAIRQTETYEWMHGISEILNALIGAGMRIDAVNDHDSLPWEMFSILRRCDDGMWRLPEGHVPFPLSWSIFATRALSSGGAL
jgi:SAM-dependent methyltransferase